MKKRLFACFLVLAMALSMMPTAFAATIVNSGDCGDDLSWTLDDAGTLTISGTGEMYDDPFGAIRSDIKKVLIEPGLTTIGKNAFDACSNLTEIEIPDGVTSIGEYAFRNCYNLKNVNIPDSVTSVGKSVFYDCKSLSKIEIPHGVTGISNWMFYGCESLTEIEIPYGVTTIGRSAFCECASMAKVVIPDSVTSIEDYAFLGCAGLADGDGFVIVRNVLYDYLGKETAVEIPDGVTEIGAEAFFYNTALTEVVIPDGVTIIDDYAFFNCEMLTTVTIPDSVTSIGVQTFSWCNNLKEIEVPDSVTFIDNMAFMGCIALADDEGFVIVNNILFDHYGYETPAVIPDGVTRIASSAMADRISLTEVVIPDSVNRIDSWVFHGCIKLEKVVFKGSAPEIMDDDSFEGNDFTAYYPVNDPSWTTDVMQDYGGTVEWVPYGFADIPYGAWYADEVQWAVDNGITNGVSETHFMPNDSCNRAQVVTFLWRAAGEPVVEGAVNPFVDVSENTFYYDAVMWAVEKGITTGADETHFDPNGICNRAQAVTFLWRAANKPAPQTESHPFADVQQSFYTDAVLWAVENGITTGMTETTFEPAANCNRAQIVTFLYRFAN